MVENQRAAVILAAGQGTRMKSAHPKVLHEVAGMPMVYYPLQRAQELGCAPRLLVVGHGAAQVEASLSASGAGFVRQEQQLGTGHALRCAAAALGSFRGTLLLLCGDVPLLRLETLERLLAFHEAEAAAVTVLTAEVADPYGYGRIVRDGVEVLRIVEEKDASAKEKALREINTGIYAFAAPFVFSALEAINCDNAQGEYYLTDVLAIARQGGERVRALVATDAEEAQGINDRVQLAAAGVAMRRRINEDLMRSGVTLVDPATTHIDPTVTIGADSVIAPGVYLHGHTSIGRNCRIEPGVMVHDCTIGDGVYLKAGSVLEGSRVGEACSIGPMAHLRPGTVLAGHNKLGNFVETKKAVLAERAQASHLTYLGDAEIGRNVNIGCGTITCNYDGVSKHRTIIGDDVFVGSDVQFVAPVQIGRGSLIGAGSTITKDVPPDALAITRSEQKNIAGWAARKRQKQKKAVTSDE
jgi:bifunctional UDP-N-acetylglucosamine pyrophosphorylase / glucosamine-1-phosphate N-acetyltransferase